MSDQALDKLQRDTFGYFLKETDVAITAVGFGLAITPSPSSGSISLAPRPRERTPDISWLAEGNLFMLQLG